jgi:formylglycine-generating enzyme required for sulfatase activity
LNALIPTKSLFEADLRDGSIILGKHLSYSPPEDCDDTNADINPDSEEIPDNNIDENCDGQAESSSFTLDGLDMTFVRIPAGEFSMGCPEYELGRDNDEVRYQVTLTRSFYMQTTEVTQGQWLAVMGLTEAENPSGFRNCGLDCPVENVSIGGIQEFLTRFNTQRSDGYEYRLPTEAEWEYAARAGSDTAFCSGDITAPEGYEPNLHDFGWYYENSDADYAGCFESNDGRCIGPQPVKGKNPNAWELFDMHGNIEEWCSDWYGDYPTGSVTDPQGPSSGVFRVVRGGAWIYGARRCRSANRDRNLPGNRRNYFGFRLAASLSGR